MMCVDTAIGAEIMFGGIGIELIQLQYIVTFNNGNTGKQNRRYDSALSAAD